MNSLFAVTLLALVACTYGAPTSHVLIDKLEDELSSLFSAKIQMDSSEDELLRLLDDVQAPEENNEEIDEDDDNGIAQLKAMLQDAQNQRKSFKSVSKKLKSYGNKAYNGAKKVASSPILKGILSHAINKYSPEPLSLDLPDEPDSNNECKHNNPPDESENNDYEDSIIELKALLQKAEDLEDNNSDDYDEDEIAELEAKLKDAQNQRWGKKLRNKFKSFGKKIGNGIKKVASNPIVKGIVSHAINRISPIPIIPSEVESQNVENENGAAELKAELEEAEIESWTDSLKKALNGAKEFAENPMAKKIGMEILDHYMPEEPEN